MSDAHKRALGRLRDIHDALRRAQEGVAAKKREIEAAHALLGEIEAAVAIGEKPSKKAPNLAALREELTRLEASADGLRRKLLDVAEAELRARIDGIEEGVKDEAARRRKLEAVIMRLEKELAEARRDFAASEARTAALGVEHQAASERSAQRVHMLVGGFEVFETALGDPTCLVDKAALGRLLEAWRKLPPEIGNEHLRGVGQDPTVIHREFVEGVVVFDAASGQILEDVCTEWRYADGSTRRAPARFMPDILRREHERVLAGQQRDVDPKAAWPRWFGNVGAIYNPLN